MQWNGTLQSTVLNNLAATNNLVKTMLNSGCGADSTKYKRNLGKVVIYLETFESESIDESPAYQVKFSFMYLFIYSFN